MTRRAHAGQFVAYAAAGGIAFVADAGALAAGVEWLDLHYLVAATIGFAVGSIVCYALSVRYVFDDRRFANWRIELVLFVAIGIIGLLLNDAAMWVGVGVLGFNYLIVKIAAAGLVFLSNFSLRKAFLFSRVDAHTATVVAPVCDGALMR